MDQIIKLLQYWKKYTDRGLGEELDRFGHWLANELSQAESHQRPDMVDLDQLPLNFKVGFLLGNLLTYVDMWSKMAFRNLPIHNFHDFGSLKFIEQEKNPTKKEIATDSLVEQSTCFEAIKRMTKKGLLEETTDETDKRVKRVCLTKYGQEVANKATEQTMKLSNLMVADLTEDEKVIVIRLLSKMEKFHNDLYLNADKSDIIKNYDL
ncbi:MAG: winged helix DNA-binding protein [Bacteroidota bacterium]